MRDYIIGKLARSGLEAAVRRHRYALGVQSRYECGNR